MQEMYAPEAIRTLQQMIHRIQLQEATYGISAEPQLSIRRERLEHYVDIIRQLDNVTWTTFPDDCQEVKAAVEELLHIELRFN
jgi:hypothetical protein